MTPLYYDRILGPNGRFATPADTANEEEVAALLSEQWGLAFHRFGEFSAIDWFCERQGQMKMLAELKSRSHPSTQFPTVWLNVRKWLALMLGTVGMGIPAVFVVKWSDGVIKWVSVADIDARRFRIGGCTKVVKARSDVEPVIDVPIGEMYDIETG